MYDFNPRMLLGVIQKWWRNNNHERGMQLGRSYLWRKNCMQSNEIKIMGKYVKDKLYASKRYYWYVRWECSDFVRIVIWYVRREYIASQELLFKRVIYTAKKCYQGVCLCKVGIFMLTYASCTERYKLRNRISIDLDLRE